MRFVLSIAIALTLALFGSASAEDAAPTVDGRYASIVVDADSLEVLHARQIDALRYPASLTKVMTLFLVFDALEAGELTLDTEMEVSALAARTSPTKLGLRAGTTLSVEDAIQGLAVKSANDAAVVVAEHLSGSVEAFTAAMTDRARSLAMKNTVFTTPNGLPDAEQVTTARDMAKLASALRRTHPDHYHWFGQKTFSFRGATYRNTNGLLHSRDDVDGFKTGFTNASGYNLMVSAERDGRRLIAVVLGGASGKARNTHMADLLDMGFERMGLSPAPERVAAAAPVVVVEQTPLPKAKPVEVIAEAPLFPKVSPKVTPNITKVLSLRRSDGSRAPVADSFQSRSDITKVATVGDARWDIRVGRFRSVEAARDQLGALFGLHDALGRDNAVIQPMSLGSGRAGFEARFTGLSFAQAGAACGVLGHLASGCALVSPAQ